MLITSWLNKSAMSHCTHMIWVVVLLLSMTMIGCDQAEKYTDIEYIQRAKDYLDKNDLLASSIELKNALQLSPDNTEARWLLGQVYFDLGKSDYAIKEFLRARNLGLPRSEWVIFVAKSYMDLARYEDLIKSIQPEENDSRNIQAEIHALRAQAYISMKQNDHAGNEISNARRKLSGDENIEVLLAEARLSALKGELPAAILQVEKSLEIDPENPDALVARAELYRYEKKYDDAITHFTKALSINPYHQVARLGRAALFLGQKKYDKAEKDLLQASKNHADVIPLRYLRALLLFHKGEYQASQNLLESILRVSSSHLQSQLLLGTVAYASGKHEVASRMLAKYLSSVPGHLPAMKLQGASLLKLDSPDKAIALLEPLAKIVQDDPQLLTLLGTAYSQSGNNNKAVEYIDRATKLDPDLAELRTQLAIVHLAGGDIEGAKTELEAALHMDEGFIEANMLMILTDIRAGRYDEAIRLAGIMVEKYPDNPVPYNLMAIANLGKKNLAEVRSHLQMALKKDPVFIPAIMNLANLDLQEGHPQDARKRYEEILKLDEKHFQAIESLARLEFDGGNQKEGIKWYTAAHEINPGAIEPSVRLVNHYISIGDKLKALSIAKQLVAEQATNPIALRVLGTTQFAANKDDNAVKTFEKLSAALKDSADAQYLLAEAYFKNRDYTASRKAAANVLELESDHLLAMFLLAKIEVFEGKEDRAMDVAFKIQEKHPNLPVGFRIEGDILYKKGSLDQALAAYEKSYAREGNADLALVIAKLRGHRGDKPGALDILKLWLNDHTDDTRVRLMLASELQQQGDTDKSIAEYEIVRAAQPKNTFVWNNLAWLYFEKDDTRCVEFAEQAYKQAPKSSVVADTLGWILWHKGDKNRALALLQEAVAQSPGHLAAKYHLAVVLAASGTKDEAIRILDEVLGNKEFPEYDKALELRGRLN